MSWFGRSEAEVARSIRVDRVIERADRLLALLEHSLMSPSRSGSAGGGLLDVVGKVADAWAGGRKPPGEDPEQ